MLKSPRIEKFERFINAQENDDKLDELIENYYCDQNFFIRDKFVDHDEEIFDAIDVVKFHGKYMKKSKDPVKIKSKKKEKTMER
jgi:hypothetical protein